MPRTPTPKPRVGLLRLQEAGLTSAWLADKLGRSKGSVYDVLHARSKTVSARIRERYENVFRRYDLEVEGMWAVVGEDHPSPPPMPTSVDDDDDDDDDDCDDDDCDDNAPNPDPSDEDDEEEIPVLTTREYLTPDDLRHFGLADDPFEDLEIHQSWTNELTRFLENRIEKAMLNRTIIAIVGEVGSGKSTMLRRLYQRLERSQVKFCSPAAIDRKRITEASLVSAMLRDLGTGEPGYSYSAEKRSQKLRELLEQLNEAGVVPVLVIDEAHDLNDQALVALKRIWDSYTTYRLLSVVMIGQLSLARRMKSTMGLRELAGRSQLYELPSLTTDEAWDYVTHRFAAIGADAEDVFERDAFDGLRPGLPRYPLWINNYAVRAMQAARDLGAPKVNRDLIARA